MAIADPERALAVAYAPLHARSALAALFALDERLGGIVAGTSEPMIGLMRLAWWREALERLDASEPPAEPLLRTIVDVLLPWVSGQALAAIEDGWAALLDGEPDAEAIARHGRARGGTLFAIAATVLRSAHDTGRLSASPEPQIGDPMPDRSGDDAAMARAGTGWALVDLGHRYSSAAVRAEARQQAAQMLEALPRRWPVALRPLGGLAVLARRDARAETRRQAAPGRILRMLALRATGL